MTIITYKRERKENHTKTNNNPLPLSLSPPPPKKKEEDRAWQSTEENVIMCPDLYGDCLKSSQEPSMNASQSLHS